MELANTVTFLGLIDKENIINEIKAKLPKKKQTYPKLLVTYSDFKNCFKLEKGYKKQWHSPYFHLLWSELNKSQIDRLRKCDIDFVNQTITIDGGKYYVNDDTWMSLEIYIPQEDRGKKEKLFPLSPRQLTSVIKEYFGNHGLNADYIQKSCKEEIIRYGCQAVFVVPNKQPLLEKVMIENQVTKRDLFEQVIDEVYNFGVRMAPRLEGLKDEKTLQRLLEGYLVGRFPQLDITPEFGFQAWKENSRIDFVIGEKQIPIEVKLCTKQPIGDYIRYGFAQVKEYLNRQKLEKGIVVIGDTTRNPQHKKHCKLEDNVQIIII